MALRFLGTFFKKITGDGDDIDDDIDDLDIDAEEEKTPASKTEKKKSLIFHCPRRAVTRPVSAGGYNSKDPEVMGKDKGAVHQPSIA